MCGQILPRVSVVLELEVEAAARLEGVKVERPLLVPSSSLLVLWVQRILASVELLSHFWKEKGDLSSTSGISDTEEIMEEICP